MHRVLTSYGRMLASKAPGSRFLQSHASSASPAAFARPYGTRLLISRQQQLLPQQRSWQAVHSMPEDLDSMLITRRALSGLEAPKRSQHQRADPVSSSASSISASEASVPDSSSDGSSVMSETESSIDWEDVQAHKRAAVQQAFINNSLAFGFSAGGLVFPYYGKP